MKEKIEELIKAGCIELARALVKSQNSTDLVIDINNILEPTKYLNFKIKDGNATRMCVIGNCDNRLLNINSVRISDEIDENGRISIYEDYRQLSNIVKRYGIPVPGKLPHVFNLSNEIITKIILDL